MRLPPPVLPEPVFEVFPVPPVLPERFMFDVLPVFVPPVLPEFVFMFDIGVVVAAGVV